MSARQMKFWEAALGCFLLALSLAIIAVVLGALYLIFSPVACFK